MTNRITIEPTAQNGATTPTASAWLDQVRRYESAELEKNLGESTLEASTVGPALALIAESIEEGNA